MHASSPNSPSPSDPDDEELRSYFDGVTKGCDVFRILLLGKSGCGKSTLVSEVFDFDLDGASVSHYTSGCFNNVITFKPGDHDINQEITSGNNKSLSLHDSKGLESGSSDNVQIITEFIQDRKGKPFAEQLHAIWYCIEVPIAGQRPFERGDISLFESLLHSDNKVPVIVVFTKIDRLQFKEQKRIKKSYVEGGMDAKTATAKAKIDCVAAAAAEYEKSCVKILESGLVPKAWTKFCVVSNKNHDSILQLIETTKSTLNESEALNVLWASAQMGDIDLKISVSLQAGKNMYWSGLGAAMIPLQGLRKITLLTVLGRIHSDVVRIWNIKDPDEILVGANMRSMIRKLFIEPIMAPSIDGSPADDPESSQIIENLAAMVMNPGAAVVPAASETLRMLDNIANTTPATARILMAYVCDLTLGMESLFWLVQPRKDKAISRPDVVHAFTTYRSSKQRSEVHMQIRDYIGDENIMRAFSRDKALKKITTIVSKSRFHIIGVTLRIPLKS
ncbi:hypothetical protein FIBSPDRAFT_900413 [Athelia psychrophila]|uniref:G domain-containing protein n=1 Tax=Athelia psychrophila TaxID=1759441 RepID=A0A165YHM7_9AGAM|nr:hypothetical protein FIBSPDRAFT_900413 [Fibularhizoctonia sp. CBS 109695]